jgi:hypothetical protein
MTIPESERDRPAQEEGKSTHKKKQYPRKTLGVAVENVSRFCPTKIGDESLERLRQVWALAQPFGALHQAISYAHIVAGLEATARHEVAWGIPYWLRKVLQFLEPQSPATGL